MDVPGPSLPALRTLRHVARDEGHPTWHFTIMLWLLVLVRTLVVPCLILVVVFPFLLAYTLLWRLPHFVWDYILLGHEACGDKYHLR